MQDNLLYSLMENKLPIALLKFFKDGKITIKEDNKKSVQLKFKDKTITINLIDISFNVPNSMDFFSKLSEARNFAKQLKENNLTLCILHKGKPVMKLGKEAKPILSRLVTKSGSVEITNLRELRKLDKRLRLN